MAYTKGAGGLVVRYCVCKSAFQDKVYGKGRRVHNCTNTGFRCTVCGRDKT